MREKMFEVMDADDVERFQNEIQNSMFKENLKSYNKRQRKDYRFEKELDDVRAKERSIVSRAKKIVKYDFQDNLEFE